LTVAPENSIENLREGESIAVEGVCLTVEHGSSSKELSFFLSAETLSRTTLGDLKSNETVNLERSLGLGDRLGGHFVMGHVDAIGRIKRLDQEGEAWNLEVEYPELMRPYLAPKGSVAISGISLTTVSILPASFTVAVIPHTYGATSLRDKRPGSPVNLEADMIARYVVQYLSHMSTKPGIDRELLEKAGF